MCGVRNNLRNNPMGAELGKQRGGVAAVRSWAKATWRGGGPGRWLFLPAPARSEGHLDVIVMFLVGRIHFLHPSSAVTLLGTLHGGGTGGCSRLTG